MNRQELKAVKRSVQSKGLTVRETEVFFVIGSGVSNQAAAKRLKIEEGTIKFHLTRVFRKLGVTNRSKLILLAHGLEPVA